MSSRRPQILMAVLLVLVLGYTARLYLSSRPAVQPANVIVVEEPPLPGKNSISNLVVRQNEAGLWQASFEYFYTGEPQLILFSVELSTDKDERSQDGWGTTSLPPPTRGSNSFTADLPYPGSATTTRQVVVRMRDAKKGVAAVDSIVASAQVDQLIDWPDWDDWVEERAFASHSPEENLKRAIEFIDGGKSDEVARARSILEKLVNRDPSLVQAYIELARVAMKTNWGPEGLHHAEGLLSSALQIQPDNANTKILMGYVYAHQERYKAAEKLFTEAAASNPRNLWLWANWGEVLAMQGRFDQAAAKYREVIERPMTHDTYDRARSDAYTKLLALLERKKDLDGMEALYQKSMVEFGDSSCFSLAYANFLLQQRGDAASAIQFARKALNVKCRDIEGRQIVGLAHYIVWSKSKDAARAEALSQARVYLPAGPMPIYLLARSEKTIDVAAQLLAAGEKVDQRDNEKLNALAHAIQNDDLQAVRRLLRLGAKPDTPVGYGDVPVALMPVMSGKLEMVKLMQQFGADYAKISYKGTTAFDFAEQTGDPELSEVLSRNPQTL